MMILKIWLPTSLVENWSLGSSHKIRHENVKNLDLSLKSDWHWNDSFEKLCLDLKISQHQVKVMFSLWTVKVKLFYKKSTFFYLSSWEGLLPSGGGYCQKTFIVWSLLKLGDIKISQGSIKASQSLKLSIADREPCKWTLFFPFPCIRGAFNKFPDFSVQEI